MAADDEHTHVKYTVSQIGCVTFAHPVYESYCCVQILTIPATDFIGWTATFGCIDSGMPHDLNVYPWCAGWQFMAHHRGSCNHLKPVLW